MGRVSLDIGRAVHHVGRLEKPAKRVGGVAVGASRRIVGNENKMGWLRGEMKWAATHSRCIWRMNGSHAIRCLYVAYSLKQRQADNGR